jgi:hypothetical protein
MAARSEIIFHRIYLNTGLHHTNNCVQVKFVEKTSWKTTHFENRNWDGKISLRVFLEK